MKRLIFITSIYISLALGLIYSLNAMDSLGGKAIITWPSNGQYLRQDDVQGGLIGDVAPAPSDGTITRAKLDTATASVKRLCSTPSAVIDFSDANWTEVCIDPDDGTEHAYYGGATHQIGCVTNYTDLIVDGDTTPGGLDTSNPTSTDYVFGTGLTAAVTGTDAAPIVTVNSDTGVVGSYVLSRQWTDVNVTGTTNETNGIVYTLPASTLGINDGVRITAQLESITYSGTGNVTIRVYFGTTVVGQITTSGAQNRILQITVFNTGSVSAQEYNEIDIASGNNGQGTAAQNTAADVTIKATIQLNDAASSFDSSMLLVEHLR